MQADAPNKELWRKRGIYIAALVAALGLVIADRIWFRLPRRRANDSASSRIGGDTSIGRGVAHLTAKHPGLSGACLLSEGRDAFAARALCARTAQRSLDVQYYIWKHDLTGRLMLAEMHRAAERGVKVRLLLDDNGIPGMDGALMALARNPMVEVRLFNPFAYRRWKPLGFLFEFRRLNRRMHNKAFLADGKVAIVGGRNIGDTYFGEGADFLYTDLDVLTIGPVVDEVDRQFEDYWRSRAAYPIESIVSPITQERASILRKQAMAEEARLEAKAYIDAVRRSTILTQLASGKLQLSWAPMRTFADHPAKAIGDDDPAITLAHQLEHKVGRPANRLDVISAYLVPTFDIVRFLVRLAQEGAKVRLITNAYSTTDVPFVHMKYAIWRADLLKGGVEIWETRPDVQSDDPLGIRADRKPIGLRAAGSSRSRLHAKTFIIDDQRVVVGSFNFDPRSIALNTELGIVIDDDILAAHMTNEISRRLPHRAYRVELGVRGSLQWVAQDGEHRTTHKREPDTGFAQRLAIKGGGWLPIEWLL